MSSFQDSVPQLNIFYNHINPSDLKKTVIGFQLRNSYKDNNGHPSGKKIHVILLKTSYKDRHEQMLTVELTPQIAGQFHHQTAFMVIRDNQEIIRWMNIAEYLETRQGKKIVFDGKKSDAAALWHERDRHISPKIHTEEVPKKIIIVNINGNVSASTIIAGDESAIKILPPLKRALIYSWLQPDSAYSPEIYFGVVENCSKR